MKTRIGIIRRPVGLLLALFVAGCAGSPPTNLYTLSAVGAPAADTRSPQSPPAVVAVGPVILPDYIDRPQIVTRKSAYQLELAAYDQWAAPLYDMLPRVLVEDVALRLPSDRVVAFPQVGDASFDYRIAVDVSRFDVDATGEATLAARWQLYARSAPRALLVADETLQRRIEGRGYDAYAASLSGRARRSRRPHRAGGELGARVRRIRSAFTCATSTTSRCSTTTRSVLEDWRRLPSSRSAGPAGRQVALYANSCVFRGEEVLLIDSPSPKHPASPPI